MARNYCFGCGKDNPEGMHLKFSLDQASRRFVARLRLPRRFQGPPGHAHGGIIATVLDEAMGKVNRLRSLVALTSEMRVEYLKPVPLGKPLIVESREIRKRGRRLVHAAELRNPQGQVLARSRG
ncbi:MAG: PaaI family thioesterase, partial [Burkholderiales bacterium]